MKALCDAKKPVGHCHLDNDWLDNFLFVYDQFSTSSIIVEKQTKSVEERYLALRDKIFKW